MANILMAWGGTDPVQSIQYCTFDGNVWSAPISPNNMGTSAMPALAVFNGTIYMAWKGVNRPGSDDIKIYYSSFDGSNWAPQQIVPNVGTTGGLSLTVFNNMLCLSWKGQGDDTRIFFSTFDGNNWTPQQIVPDALTQVGPGMVAY
jgi:hypothetical protein